MLEDESVSPEFPDFLSPAIAVCESLHPVLDYDGLIADALHDSVVERFRENGSEEGGLWAQSGVECCAAWSERISLAAGCAARLALRHTLHRNLSGALGMFAADALALKAALSRWRDLGRKDLAALDAMPQEAKRAAERMEGAVFSLRAALQARPSLRAFLSKALAAHGEVSAFSSVRSAPDLDGPHIGEAAGRLVSIWRLSSAHERLDIIDALASPPERKNSAVEGDEESKVGNEGSVED